VARMREWRDVYRVLAGRPEVKRPLGRPGRRSYDNIKLDLQVSQDRVQWWDFMNMAMNLRVP